MKLDKKTNSVQKKKKNIKEIFTAREEEEEVSTDEENILDYDEDDSDEEEGEGDSVELMREKLMWGMAA